MTLKPVKPLRALGSIGLYGFLTAIALVVLFPLGFMVINSLKEVPDFARNPFGSPSTIAWGNYVSAWINGRFSVRLGVSLLVTGTSVVSIVGIGALASYPIARRLIRGGSRFYLLFISGIFIPAQITYLPLVVFARVAGLNNILGLILTMIAFQLPMAILVFVGFIKGLPKELDESGRIDGLGDFAIFRLIILPILSPAVSVVVITASLAVWNNFFYSFILLKNVNNSPLPLGLFAFKSSFRVTYTELFAYMTSMLVPMLTLYVLMQRNIIKGLTAGAVKQ